MIRPSLHDPERPRRQWSARALSAERYIATAIVRWLPPSLQWAPHNLIAHPLSELLYLVGMRGASGWVHDATIPREPTNAERGHATATARAIHTSYPRGYAAFRANRGLSPLGASKAEREGHA